MIIMNKIYIFGGNNLTTIGGNMANSPVDKGNDFIQSGMTLITERNADYWLSRYKDWKAKKDSVTGQLNSILHNVDK